MPSEFYPATERQIRYARELGINFPDGLSVQQMSDLIHAALNPPATPELKAAADAMGVWYSDETTQPELESRIKAFAKARRWIYSVIKHIAKANWVVYSDCPIEHQHLWDLTVDLMANAALMEKLHEQEDGIPPVEFDMECDRRRINTGDADEWFWFQRDGANARTVIYRKTRDMLIARFPENFRTSEDA